MGRTWRQEVAFDSLQPTAFLPLEGAREPSSESAPATPPVLAGQVSPQRDPEGHVWSSGSYLGHGLPAHKAWSLLLPYACPWAPRQPCVTRSLRSRPSRSSGLLSPNRPAALHGTSRTLNTGNCLGLLNYPKDQCSKQLAKAPHVYTLGLQEPLSVPSGTPEATGPRLCPDALPDFQACPHQPSAADPQGCSRPPSASALGGKARGCCGENPPARGGCGPWVQIQVRWSPKLGCEEGPVQRKGPPPPSQVRATRQPSQNIV